MENKEARSRLIRQCSFDAVGSMHEMLARGLRIPLNLGFTSDGCATLAVRGPPPSTSADHWAGVENRQ